MLLPGAIVYRELRRGRPDVLNQITVSFEGDHILVLTEGDKDYEYLEQLWSQEPVAVRRAE